MRYYYSTTGYGIFTLMGELYRVGRIEMYDNESPDGFAINEGMYYVPHKSSEQFEDFIENFESDLPIFFELNDLKICEEAVAKELGCTTEQIRDSKYIKKYYEEKHKET